MIPKIENLPSANFKLVGLHDKKEFVLNSDNGIIKFCNMMYADLNSGSHQSLQT